jgi:hypothetical protein
MVTRPAILVVEAIGLGLLAWVARRGGLHRKGGLRQLLLSGRLPSTPSTSGVEGTTVAQKGKAKE